MPFYSWLPRTRQHDPGAWQAAVAAHDRWLDRLDELAPAVVLGSRPVTREGKRLNEGFSWDRRGGYQAAHTKYYLPDDEGFWEASWYNRGEGDFTPLWLGSLGIGFAICTELWFLERSRAYGKLGVHLIASPRATLRETADKWLVGGRACAVVSGAYSLSSNRVSPPGAWPVFGGQGWIIGPDGDVLGLTSAGQPFATLEIDLEQAQAAKQTYPRYVQE
jgi:N-carbamoylputrescine amidase